MIKITDRIKLNLNSLFIERVFKIRERKITYLKIDKIKIVLKENMIQLWR